MGMTYRESGVDYGAMDPFKRLCQEAAVLTAGNQERFGAKELRASRGESVYLTEFPWGFLGHVEEGLGTKNYVADQMKELTGRCFYNQVLQCNGAMIFNDMITLGALPFLAALHLAVGDSGWFKDEERCQAVARGFALACNLAGATWGCGETPTLRRILYPGVAELSGSAVGIIMPKSRLIDPVNIAAGDRIILLASSTIHANGLTMTIDIAEKLPDGFATLLSNGQTYGEALLAPTVIYVKLIEKLQEAGVPIHYAVNITGHGWRKLMRALQAFTYIIERIPEPHPVFRFIQEQGPVEDREAYGNLNMGAGFALYVAPEDVVRVIAIAQECGITAWDCGYIESGPKRVHIQPKDLTWNKEELEVR